jgi:hypothetical protein
MWWGGSSAGDLMSEKQVQALIKNLHLPIILLYLLNNKCPCCSAFLPNGPIEVASGRQIRNINLVAVFIKLKLFNFPAFNICNYRL